MGARERGGAKTFNGEIAREFLGWLEKRVARRFSAPQDEGQ
jgi:hypothetical protein